MRIKICSLIAVAGLVLAFVFGSGGAQAAIAQNSQSPLGINLASPQYYSPEIPFLNIFKNGSSWITTTNSKFETYEEKYLQLDAGGWVKSLTASPAPPGGQQFTSVQVLLNYDLPNTPNGPYPAGQYVVLYDGAGTMTYGLDATLVTSSPGRDVINVATAKSGISLHITSTDPNRAGNYIRNIRIVKATQESTLNGGQVFNPTFLSLIRNFRVVRFMGWLVINDNPLSSWSDRPLPTDAWWGSLKGVPIETVVQLANAISADAWVNVPHMADNNYITQFATLVHNQLGSTQKVYVEYSNETWNYGFSQATWIQAQGQAQWPGAPTANPYAGNRNWYGMRVAQMCDIWKSVWGADASRVVCVLAAQSANPYTATSSLDCSLWTGAGHAPCSAHGIGVVAIGDYFGGPIPSAWTSDADGGLARLFASCTTQNDPTIPAGGWLGQASNFAAAYATALAPYHLPMVVYEGGAGFSGAPTYADGSPMVNLLNAANRDPRIATVYTSLLNRWKANGGQMFAQFEDISQFSQWGEWGALESVMQNVTPLTSAPPKWQALQNFISANPCWWSGCAGTIDSSVATPMAPANLRVQ